MFLSDELAVPDSIERRRALRKKASMGSFGSVAVQAPLLLALLGLVGCSVSTSSESSAESSKSSASISRSSASAGRKASYREDVRTYTAAYVRSSGPFDVFEKQLGELARQYGVTNWEDDEATYVGIGEGLGEASVGQAQLATYTTHLSRSDPLKMQAIQRGYDTRH